MYTNSYCIKSKTVSSVLLVNLLKGREGRKENIFYVKQVAHLIPWCSVCLVNMLDCTEEWKCRCHDTH